MTPNESTRLELAITELRGSMDAALARIEGRLELLVQRAEQSDQRAAAQDRRLDRHDERLDALERTTITREELDEREARMRAAMDEQARRRLTVVGTVMTCVMGAITAAIGIIAIIVN